VWPIDYARPPLPLDEGYADLPAVRDLASGMQLLWLPVAEATAATTAAALLSLFTIYGALLILKLDNGSPFVAAMTRGLLARWGVITLYSPPGCPQYNGAIEAGIGGAQVRTHYQAVRQGRRGEWTLEDAEATRQEANTLGRPWRARGPTPAECWAARREVTTGEREAFAASAARLEEDAACAPAAPGVTEAAPAPGPVAPAESATAAEHPASRALAKVDLTFRRSAPMTRPPKRNPSVPSSLGLGICSAAPGSHGGSRYEPGPSPAAKELQEGAVQLMRVPILGEELLAYKECQGFGASYQQDSFGPETLMQRTVQCVLPYRFSLPSPSSLGSAAWASGRRPPPTRSAGCRAINCSSTAGRTANPFR
jgi:hypothetical protein